jgi:hypothetical protein
VLNGFYRNGVVLAAVMTCLASASAVGAQENVAPGPQTDERRTVGTVSSLGRGSIVIYTDEGKFMVYEVEPSIRLAEIEPGSRVRVITSSTDYDPAPTALAIDKLPPRQGLAEQQPEPVPVDVRRLEAQLERAARRYHVGFTGGVALDPELISLNGFATFSPFRQRGLMVRPNFELAFGELTTLIGVHVEGLYMLPGFRRSIRWSPYVGAGPNFTFSHRGIDEEEFIDDVTPEVANDDDRFDFSQWDWNNGWNFIIGARNPNGTFFEMKATAWGVANIRMLAGVQF